jgi:hypothetical protein
MLELFRKCFKFLMTFALVLNVDSSTSVCSVVIQKFQQKQCVASRGHVSA